MSYLQNSEFIIKTDQRSLTHLDDQRLTTPWQHKALTKLLGLRYRICYKQGIENRATDALSRIPNGPHQQVMAISTLQPMWLQEIADAYPSDPKTAKILAQLAVSDTYGHFSLHQRIIKFRGRVWVVDNKEIQLKIIRALHSSLVGGHSGFLVTLKGSEPCLLGQVRRAWLNSLLLSVRYANKLNLRELSTHNYFNLFLCLNLLGK